jgi:exo-beta-1,3-glucanase (GH17 family)
MKMKNIRNLLFLSMLLSFMACNTSPKSGESSEAKSLEKPLQTKSMLLNGVSAAVCYSGFRSGQHPDRGDGAVNPDYEEVLEDLQILTEQTPFRLIRMYDCGENTQLTLRVISENELDFKVLLGIWLRAELSAHETCEWLTEPIPQETLDKNKILNALEIEKGILLANEFKDIIVAVNVGNEALVDWNDHKVSTESIIEYVQQVKAGIRQQVTVADNYKWWADHGQALAEEVDFVSIHVYPVWEGKDIDEGMSYTIQNVEEVMAALPGKQIVITEAGWATIATEFGERASQEKQQQYVDELLTWAKVNNITTFIFEAFDEDWKGDPGDPLGAEKHWGLYTVARVPKQIIGLFSTTEQAFE